ncbi:MAG: adenylate kinase [Candidatus Coatesbacteria bacterium]|nr:adenylate kinase [Candidatus Coatesbacteria bacterium]
MRLVLMGAPGSGKGTQAKILAQREGLVHLSTGDALRAAIASGSELGLKAKDAVEQGRLVSDEVLYGIVKNALENIGREKGFILDGFPRNLSQAEFLDGVLSELGMGIDAAVLLDVPETFLIKRLSERRICSQCSKEYHLEFSPPDLDGKCNDCGDELYQRDDDRPEKIARRLSIYSDVTLPMVDYYKGKGLLLSVDAVGEINDVAQRVLDSLKNYTSKRQV